MTHPFCDQLKSRQSPRAGIRFAEASVASRSEADSCARGGIFACFGSSLRSTTVLKALIPPSISSRTHSSWIRFPQFADQKFRKINLPLSLPGPFYPHLVANKCFADKALAPAPFDLPVASHPACHHAAGIAQQHIPLPRRLRTIDVAWRPLPQPFVRSDLVVGFYPTVRPPLLSSQVDRSRARRFGFQYPMHLLVRSILPRVPRLYEFDSNPQRRPPSTQSRKPSWTSRSKGRTIVHAHDLRISLLPKQTQKDPPHWLPALISQQADAQQISTEQIPHCQWFHSLPVLSPKPTFEVHRPDLVAPSRHGQDLAVQFRSSPGSAAAAAIQFQPLEPLANRSRRGRLLTWIFFA